MDKKEKSAITKGIEVGAHTGNMIFSHATLSIVIVEPYFYYN